MNKIEALKRIPPGDRWTPSDEIGNIINNKRIDRFIFVTLTDGLEWLYKNYDCKKFIVDAEEQMVYMIENTNDNKKPDTKYSIYGE